MMKVIVTGGRAYSNYDVVFKALEELKPTLVIQGGATGADYLARQYCRLQNVPELTYKADWQELGPKAGPLRNRKMLEENQDAVLVAFQGRNGTANCIATARSLGMTVKIVEEE